MATAAEVKPVLATSSLPVFEKGAYTPTSITVNNTSNSSSPPKPLFIVCPKEQGTFNVILFLHGTSLKNNSYSQLFQHIASHGFIIVAPQLYTFMPPSGNKEVESAAEVTNWLSTGLQSNLPENVKANLSLLALMGHSRGGQMAFALAVGYAKDPQVSLQYSAIIGIDPVAGTKTCTELNPPILSFDSFNFSTPVTVIGTGLGGVTKCVVPCAPEGANYEEFFGRCTNSSRAQFVAANYGHMDVLDDNPSDLRSWAMSKCICTNGKGPRDPMRRCVGGIVVAFLEEYFDNQSGDFETIKNQPSVAPIELDSVEFIPA